MVIITNTCIKVLKDIKILFSFSSTCLQEKKAERARQKLAKEAEKEMRRAEREAKKTYSINSCLQVGFHARNTVKLELKSHLYF